MIDSKVMETLEGCSFMELAEIAYELGVDFHTSHLRSGSLHEILVKEICHETPIAVEACLKEFGYIGEE